ncbi:MAG: radical SAM family heme chaperone HemW [Oscillospiraceae bacterium]|nr:radical SAM family heme chaperone HemW [Oscillospiraceae bacterium]
MIGLYLHIPFCAAKCPYCDFYSRPIDGDLADRYAAALVNAMATQPYGDLRADTLYLGGGTPTLLGAGRLTAILEAASRCFGLTADSEITIETNPESIDLALLCDLRKAGCNRLSVGVQSGAQSELTALGRRHTPESAREAILAGAKAGFENISADLMLAIPGQTGKSLSGSVRMLTGLPLSHISAYLLKLEPGTPLALDVDTLTPPDEDLTAALYLQCVDELADAGFEQYEISNFAKQGRQSRHNLKYWRREQYLGLGPAAHSFLEPHGRFCFESDLDAFLDSDNPFAQIQPDDLPVCPPEEELLLRLRLTEGVNVSTLAIDPTQLLRKAGQFAAHDLCRVDGTVIALTPKGFLLSNLIIVALLETLAP